MTLRDYTLIACGLTTLGTVAQLVGIVDLPLWVRLAPVAVLAVAVGVAFVMLVRRDK